MWASGVAPAGGETYVERGNTGAVDWSQASGLTIGASLYVLDLSAVVPAAAAGKNVHFKIKFKSTGIQHSVWIKPMGYADFGNSYEQNTLLANEWHWDTFTVKCDADRKINYQIHATECSLTVRGWWV